LGDVVRILPARNALLVKMQDEHRDEGFEVLGLNIDDESLMRSIRSLKK
jgi:hypothetical protein